MAWDARSKHRDCVLGSQTPTGPESNMLFSPERRKLLFFSLKDDIHIDKEQSSQGPRCHWREKSDLSSPGLSSSLLSAPDLGEDPAETEKSPEGQSRRIQGEG